MREHLFNLFFPPIGRSFRHIRSTDVHLQVFLALLSYKEQHQSDVADEAVLMCISHFRFDAARIISVT